MTKADILRKLERVPMNAEVMFVAPASPSFSAQEEFEHEVGAAFTVTGMRGLTVLLTDGHTPSSEEYLDLESM
jgi:glyoxylase-like metal-dependent hydrolase (beta-lactamase superfamily II)